ncbi:Uncharacterised protein [Legionella lansingensis]|uniref:Transporter n=1 Tax=Legionella lansingensis TaxID=45067 RepID=A0A0W0VWI1_9GAMM|nr:transporter [Legionella lansingensis]KTD24369.1 hypothetical protein Llan_0508 [Legionella lansingensis]SNV51645.1 Uncharacterised protein [Legionella lansingensis]
MLTILSRNFLIPLIIISCPSANVFAQEDNPCLGPSEILNITQRGGNINNACVVPFKRALLAGGWERQTLKPNGWLQDYPQLEFSLGLPGNSEIDLTAPNYNRTNLAPFSGYTSLSMDFKHQLGYTQQWATAVNGLLIFPGGSSGFGSRGLGVALSGMINYNLNDQWSVTAMLEGGSYTDPTSLGGERYTVYTPDVEITYAATSSLNFYGEMFGDSRTGPGEKGTVILDCGLLYMINSNIAIDLGIYRQLTNNPNVYQYSFVGGITLEL